MRTRRPFITGPSSSPVIKDHGRRLSYIERAKVQVDVAFVTPEEEKRKKKRRRQQFQAGPEVPDSQIPEEPTNYWIAINGTNVANRTVAVVTSTLNDLTSPNATRISDYVVSSLGATTRYRSAWLLHTGDLFGIVTAGSAVPNPTFHCLLDITEEDLAITHDAMDASIVIDPLDSGGFTLSTSVALELTNLFAVNVDTQETPTPSSQTNTIFGVSDPENSRWAIGDEEDLVSGNSSSEMEFTNLSGGSTMPAHGEMVAFSFELVTGS